MPKNPRELIKATGSGRINRDEYSKLTGKPIPEDAAPSAAPKTRKSAAQTKKRIATARKMTGTGRINEKEASALWGSKKSRRKATSKRSY